MKEHYLKGKAKDTHFSSLGAYRKYLAYVHIHNVPHHKANWVMIGTRKHKVNCHYCWKASHNPIKKAMNRFER